MKFIGKTLLVEVGDKKILAVGDLHLGYEEFLNNSGVFVSRKMFEEMIEEFDKIFEKSGKIDEVVLLGDVKHNFGSIMKQEWDDVLALIDYLFEKCKKVIIIKGNHDKIIEPIARKGNVSVKEKYFVGEYCFLHGDQDFEDIYNKKIKFWVLGHGHPAIKISDGVKVEKYKCFLTGKFKDKELIVVPSFFSYSQGSDPRESDLGLAWKIDFSKFNVKVVNEDLEVLDFGLLKKLR